MTLAVRGLELAVAIEHAPTVLHLIARRAQPLDSRVAGHHARDLFADGVRAGKGDLVALLRAHAGREILEDFPLTARLADAGAGHLRREDDAPPCTRLWPRIGTTPQCSLPSQPCESAILTMACTFWTPNVCCVMPILQTRMPVFALCSVSAKASICARGRPERRSSVSQSWAASVSTNASQPVVCRAMNSWSTQSRSIRYLSVPFKKATSPPVAT